MTDSQRTDDPRPSIDDEQPVTVTDQRESNQPTDRPRSTTDRDRAAGVQSPAGAIDPTDATDSSDRMAPTASAASMLPTAESESSLPLQRRHVIASVLAAFGLGAMGGVQARHDSGSNGQGHGRDGIDVKTGIVSHDSPGAADDGTWNTFEVDQQTVEFDEDFEAPPVVFIGSTSYTTIGLFRAVDVTETGFESRWMVYRSTSFAAPDAQWIAIGSAQP